jgi:CheY-like chemotaxis protein
MSALRVLIVDDNQAIADLLALLVVQMGYDALATYDGEDALADIKTFDPDVVLVDIFMPGLDGFSLCPMLRQAVAHPIKVIAVSGFTKILSAERFAEGGFDAYISKPASAETLKRLLADADITKHRDSA